MPRKSYSSQPSRPSVLRAAWTAEISTVVPVTAICEEDTHPVYRQLAHNAPASAGPDAIIRNENVSYEKSFSTRRADRVIDGHRTRRRAERRAAAATADLPRP